MTYRGRPILGAVCGIFFGLFVAIDLVLFRVTGSGSTWLAALPVLFLIVGLALGLTGPFGRERARRRALVAEDPPVGPSPLPPPDPGAVSAP